MAPFQEAPLITNILLRALAKDSSDIVSLHAPHTDETEKLLIAKRIASMKSTAILVNTSRGGLVDEEALAEAQIGAAVLCSSRLPKAHPLTKLDNVVPGPSYGRRPKRTHRASPREHRTLRARRDIGE